MAQIYQSSFLTLAASWSPDSSSGCFAGSMGDPPTHELTAVDWQSGIQCKVFARKRLPHFFGSHSPLDDFPLLKRGWVYQERLLSPRVLHFGKRELIWECREDTRCQCHNPANVGFFDPPKIIHGIQMASPSSSIYGAGSLWNRHVEEYTRLSLSQQSDLLPALRGLATQEKSRHIGRYLSGLWEDTLIHDLCWHDYGRGGTRPKTWRAPTWSWASINSRGIRNFAYEGAKGSPPLASVLEVQTVPSDPGPNDNLLLGIITLRGLVISARFRYPGKLNVLGSKEEEALRSFIGDCSLRNGELLQCMKLYAATRAALPKTGFWMVVRRVPDDVNVFERVGMAMLFEKDLERFYGLAKELEIRVR
jgi:hypothetical protein